MGERADVVRWRDEVPGGVVARVVAAVGVGSRTAGEVALVAGGAVAEGGLLAGAADAEVLATAAELERDAGAANRVVAVTIRDDAASTAGLTCGGLVDILVQRLADLPDALFDAVRARRPVALASRVDAPGVVVVTAEGAAGSLGDAATDEWAATAASALLIAPAALPQRLDDGPDPLVVEGWSPSPRLVVVGPSGLADALAAQAALVGWETVVVGSAPEGVDAAAALGPGDGLVVLDHDLSTTTGPLAAALQRGIGYVGALGSRRTQQRRRAALLEHDPELDGALDRLHGPAGLDLGAGTPAEIALAIVAEALAARRGRAAASLRTTTGTIH